ncbi:MAG TPA: hypothetical protein VE199_04405, partial [Nitrososphaera sp.]|nr:hypothetical protein [Nitrososphaera sp.]
MDVHITQFNVQLYFRQPVLQDIDRLNTAFSQLDVFAARNIMLKNNDDDDSSNNNYYRHHPTQNTVSFFKDGFRIAPVQSNVLP